MSIVLKTFFPFFTILSLTILIRVIYEKSVLNITSESYKEKFQIISDNSQNVLENAELCLDKYVTNDLIWDYKNDYPETDVESNELKVKISII